MKPILSVQNLCTRFDTFDGSVFAVNDVSFDLMPGETLAVVGESGSGKSVTMLSILGLLPRSSSKVSGHAYYSAGAGAAEVDLISLSSDELNRYRGNHISIIFQDALRSLNPVLTVGEQITESLATHKGYDKKKAYKRAIELLELVGISQPDKRFNNYPHMFSGGMRQRAMIAIAISCTPDILIADEPTTALDVTIQTQIIELTRHLQHELGMAVIWITHDLGVVAGLAERVLVMYGGTGVETAPVDQLYEKPLHPYTQGLLGAIPSIAGSGTHRLVSIEGSPPDMFQKPKHCQYTWRCPHVFERCWNEIPPAFEVAEKHFSKCFYDLIKKEPRAEDR
ncbi:MAG: ABC transporter ATP-binding protein [Bacillota bacterium]|nr:ABC transporter ATP-binding protein [Bacillota bacterium]MDW7728649.1 ABC transporter ATP-binding protein [Bacillota bacterium]